LTFTLFGWTQQLPPIYFNHVYLYMDKPTLDDLIASSFLEKEFSAFQKQTTQRDGGAWSYTGVYCLGQGTYLEFMPGASKDEPPKKGVETLGSVGIGMWIDHLDQLALVRDNAAKHVSGKSEIHEQRVFQNGHDVHAFDAIEFDYPKVPSVLTQSFVMAIYPIPDSHPPTESADKGKGIARESRYTQFYAPEKLFRGVTRISLTVNSAEGNRLAEQFAAYGYMLRNEGDRKIASGPDFELQLVPAAADTPRKIAIGMKLNRAKEGPQVVKIGSTSELRFDADSAVWYFPSHW
jgi:hypothetical protein